MERADRNIVNDTLVVEISGKRPGTSKQRPTENAILDYPHIIISNNSDGYDTGWEIVNVPDDFRKWYIENVSTSEKAWYAPMNRSYAIKYAREHGYRYLVQLDDNITKIALEYGFTDGDIKRVYRGTIGLEGLQDVIELLICILKNTNAGMAGCDMMGCSPPGKAYLSERYVYSLFALKLASIPDRFQGDFEDDVEFRLKLAQMGIPAVQCVPIRYGKTSQNANKDTSGCRAAYVEAGVKRGENMSKIHGDVYKRGMRSKSNGLRDKIEAGKAYFQHRLKSQKVGVVVYDKQAIDDKMRWMLKAYAKEPQTKYKVQTHGVGDSNGETEERD